MQAFGVLVQFKALAQYCGHNLINWTPLICHSQGNNFPTRDEESMITLPCACKALSVSYCLITREYDLLSCSAANGTRSAFGKAWHSAGRRQREIRVCANRVAPQRRRHPGSSEESDRSRFNLLGKTGARESDSETPKLWSPDSRLSSAVTFAFLGYACSQLRVQELCCKNALLTPLEMQITCRPRRELSLKTLSSGYPPQTCQTDMAW